MSQVTPLASGTVNGHDQLIIELVESADADAHPPVIGIRWLSKATVTTAAAYDQVAANVMRLLANASTTLAGIKVRKKL
jgi:hypothetical protein